jgi:hypothetical protein
LKAQIFSGVLRIFWLGAFHRRSVRSSDRKHVGLLTFLRLDFLAPSGKTGQADDHQNLGSHTPASNVLSRTSSRLTYQNPLNHLLFPKKPVMR